MNPPTILLDRTFLVAVANPGDDNHDNAVLTYGRLVDEYVERRCLLAGRADHLAALAATDLFAPVDKLHVARQHQYAAAKVQAENLDADLAITLVLIRRLRIRTVASFDIRLAGYDIDLVTYPDLDSATSSPAPS